MGFILSFYYCNLSSSSYSSFLLDFFNVKIIPKFSKKKNDKIIVTMGIVSSLPLMSYTNAVFCTKQLKIVRVCIYFLYQL